VQIYEKEIIQTNNLSKNEKIQRNNLVKSKKIQRNKVDFPAKPVSGILSHLLISNYCCQSQGPLDCAPRD
jgi:hypothetical protein